jgi:RNA polymerase sigma-70 factor (ECF subfamily)
LNNSYKIKTDIELISLIQNSDDPNGAFAELYARYSKKIWFFCKKMTDNDGDDVFQDLFIALFNSIRQGATIDNVNAYLFRAARNRCLNHIQSRRKTIAIGDDAKLDLFANQDGDKLIKKESEQMIENAVESLDEKYKTAFVLQTYYDMSYQEIAEIIQEPVSTVRNRVVRAKSKLRNYLAYYFEREKM